jgi:GWxTD domain-containing protein
MVITNYGKNIMRIKIYAILLFSLAITILGANQLGMFVDVKRFFDENKNTKFVIDYQIPYKNLVFLSGNKLFFAEVKVTINIANSDSILVTKEFVNSIGVSNRNDVISPSKSYLDRISMVLSKPGYRLIIDFEDVNSKKTYSWEYQTELLQHIENLSDIEIVTKVTADTASFSQKFMRHNKIMIPEPSFLIAKDRLDTLFLYVEYKHLDNSPVIKIFIDSEQIFITNINPKYISDKGYILYPVNIKPMGKGKYQGQIELMAEDNASNRSFEFILTEPIEEHYSVFADPEDDILLIKYISPSSVPTNWKTFTKEAKRNYVTAFWVDAANSRRLSASEIIAQYKDKIDFCNKRYSHFDKGWKSDMGRIYLRNGSPNDIEKDRTTDDTRYVRKDFQIWKYTGANHAVYIFVDVQMNGNYKLVYVNNDDNESTNPDWRKYLGSDFDESLIENWIFKNTQE